MKKVVISLALVGLMSFHANSMAIGQSFGSVSQPTQESSSVAMSVVPSVVNKVVSGITDHKAAVVVLATAVTLGLSLKYCSWMRGLVGLETEEDIEEGFVFIQDDQQ